MAQAHALTADEAKAIAIGESDTRIEALNKAVATADDKTAAFIQALADDAVKCLGGKVFIVRDGKGIDPVTGAPSNVPDDAEDVVNNNRMRGELDPRWRRSSCSRKDAPARRSAVANSLQKEPDESRLPLIEKASPPRRTRDQGAAGPGARRGLLGSSDKAKRLEAAQAAGRQPQPGHQALLVSA
jgi:urea transport system permease protein